MKNISILKKFIINNVPKELLNSIFKLQNQENTQQESL